MSKRKLAKAAAPSPRRRPEWLPHAALAGLALAVYANTLGNGFIGDDKIQLLKNPLLAGIGNLPQLFNSSVWSILGISGNYYRPFQFVLYLLIAQSSGFSAPAFHLFMIAVHAVNTVLLYVLVRRLARPWTALMAGALFAVHPIHTETVDWIAALPDLTVTTLALAGISWFARQNGAPRGAAIAGHSLIYFLALLTKETGVMLLPLYAGYEVIYLRHRWKDFRGNLGFCFGLAAAFAVYLAMRIHALGGLAPGQQTFFHLSPGAFALSAVAIAGKYAAALLWPAKLNYFHVFHPTEAITVGFAVSAVVLAAAAAAFFRSRSALIRYGIFWIAVTLAPALNLTGVGQNVFAERYLYLPSAAFCWIVACAWNRLFERYRTPAWIAAAVVLLACSLTTTARNRDWRDDFTLLSHTLQQSPTSGWLHNSMAGVYVERNQFEQALQQERLAVRYEPRSPVFHRNLGNILLGKDPRAAIAEFQTLVALEPGRAENHCDLALAFEAAGDATSAAAEYSRALQLEPQLWEAQEGHRRTATRVR